MAGLTDHKPSALEKWLLVHYKRYPKGQVPDFVPQGQMEKVRNLARIQVNIGMCVATFFGALVAIYIGKRDRSQGTTLQKINMDWHASFTESAEKEKAAKEAKPAT